MKNESADAYTLAQQMNNESAGTQSWEWWITNESTVPRS